MNLHYKLALKRLVEIFLFTFLKKLLGDLQYVKHEVFDFNTQVNETSYIVNCQQDFTNWGILQINSCEIIP